MSEHNPDFCSHSYIYRGLEYYTAQSSNPGGSGRTLTFFDVYFCEKCLKERVIRRSIEGLTQHSTLPPGVTPNQGLGQYLLEAWR